MQRLTHKELNSLGSVYFTKCASRDCKGHCICCDIPDEAEHKLKEYEDLEEQGLILKLPFKVDDNVYSVECEKVEVYTVTSFRVHETAIYAYHRHICIGEVGMSVFATKEEAEEALRKKVE